MDEITLQIIWSLMEIEGSMPELTLPITHVPKVWESHAREGEGKMKEQEEIKLMNVLEFFLSLHEADVVFDAILDDKITLEQLNTMLYSYRDTKEAQP